MNGKAGFWVLVLVLVAALVAALAWFWQQQRPVDVGVAPPLPPAVQAPYDAAQAPQAAASQPAVLFPVEPAASDAAPVTTDGELGQALLALLGSGAGQQLLQTAEFPRRFVATVDNLGRNHAPPSAWPIQPAPQRFSTLERDGKTVIDPANATRYDPVVRLLTSIDIGRATELYVRIYPLLQKAYEDIGFPNRHFNDRFVEVIDLLLATPEPAGPLAVRLVEVKGPLPSTRPWVRYEFAEPRYEGLAAGQKILLRVGAEHRARLKARLTELRRALTGLQRR